MSTTHFSTNSRRGARSTADWGQRKCRQTGFGLIEVLISVFIFAVGVLGVGALQLISKQAGVEASQRIIAAELAFELLERIRLNNHSLITEASPLATYVADGASLSATAPLTGVADCVTGTCTRFQLPDFDLSRMLGAALGATEVRDSQNVGGLVDPTICVTGPANGASGAYQVTIAWRGKASLADTHSTNGCGSGGYGTNDEFRRILTLSTYISHVDDQ